MKKGFTIAETVITLAILGVIASIVIPVMNNSQPNKDIVMYNKALYTLQSAIPNVLDETYTIAMSGTSYVPEDFLANLSRKEVCKSLADNINTKGPINCDITGSASEPNFTSTDGIKFYNIGYESSENFATYSLNGIPTDVCDGNCQKIMVDYQLTNADRDKRKKDGGNKTINMLGLQILIRNDGKIIVPEEFEYENSLIKASTALKVEKVEKK